MNKILQGNALERLKELQENTADLLVTDPPYGYAFMNKDWDKAVVSVDIWRECLRVLKPGAFAFIMSSPRQDVLCKMILNLIDAGFETNFTSLYWAYASGFPKAADVSKLVDKRNGRNQDVYQPFADYLKEKRLEKKLSMNKIDEMLGTNTAYSWWEGRLSGIQLPTKYYYLQLKQILDLDNRFDELIEREEAEREIIGKSNDGAKSIYTNLMPSKTLDITKPATEAAKRLEGSYAGFQPKPAVEVILVCMKPLDQKTYVDQALANRHGITWLDDCRIPYQNEDDADKSGWQHYDGNRGVYSLRKFGVEQGFRPESNLENINKTPDLSTNDKGRFPANLLVSDDVLNDGSVHKSGSVDKQYERKENSWKFVFQTTKQSNGDEGSFSRYFSLDKWAEKTFPFLIVPKASKAEKDKGLESSPLKEVGHSTNKICGKCGKRYLDYKNTCECEVKQEIRQTARNFHPTVKPLQLMSYLITMGSRPNDLVLDPFAGSGTTLIATYQLARNFIGIDISQEYIDIANKRLERYIKQQRITEFAQT